ncbi:hypothetical protein BVRB_6g149440 [Beta vulgaris subsp. vulgaris]|nr:hypothetical protein BVRB_6g149440 [Beta vulgaris subsp. vulgaris]
MDVFLSSQTRQKEIGLMESPAEIPSLELETPLGYQD